MPYIITTRTPAAADISRLTHDPARGGTTTTQTAVATLDEARELIAARYDRRTAVLATSHGIDLVGPLPDGTVIEVQHVSWPYLHVLSGTGVNTHDAILAAFNDAQEG